MSKRETFDYFGSLAKSPRSKKVKTDSQSNISFWDNINVSLDADPITNVISDDFDFSFTSTEIPTTQHTHSDSSSVKFIIRDIERQGDKILLCGSDVVCTVIGEWTEINYEVNTKITIVSCLCCDIGLTKTIVDNQILITVDDTQNFLFLEDDLMTITNVISAIRCFNRPYVNRKVADLSFDFQDKCLINGIVLHSVIEDCLIAKNFSKPFIMEAAKKAINDNAVNIYCCNTTEKNVLHDISESLNNIISFAKHNLTFQETEKRISSLVFNLKGNIDAVGPNNILEIKSGKSLDVSHKAQVILYSLIMKEKFKEHFDAYLFYTATNNLLKVEIKHNEVRSLFILRNKLALESGVVDCNCHVFEACKIINKIVNLSEEHYLKKMWNAIEKEEQCRLRETWNRVIFKKQLDVTVVFKLDFDPSVVDDIYCNIYNEDLIKLCKGIISSINEDLLTVSLSEKINLENNQFYFISFGCNDLFFKYLRYSLINIAYYRFLDNSGSNGFKLPGEEFGIKNSDDLESFDSEEVTDSCDGMIDSDDLENEDKKSYDSTNKDFNPVIMNEIERKPNYLNNDYVSDCSSSSFIYFTPPSPEPSRFKFQIPEAYKTQFLSLNNEQRHSLFSALNCEYFKIIHGMPGTGKSSIIVLLIKILISLNLKVLLVCYTNLAITNILDKLKTVRSYRARKETIDFKASDDIRNYYKNVDLVASTCFGFSDPIFLNRKFDFCIIDEGSQQHLLLTLIPVSMSNRFVIFGDHLQLKPLVKTSKDLATSLFEYLLDDDHLELHTQYRMGQNIMRLSNILFYDNKLVAGNIISDSVSFIDSTTIDYPEFIRNIKNATILCYFNSQVKLTKLYTDCPVETIDRFQGSEADHIVVVFDPITVCEVMLSPQRLNVALTRAKKKLTLIGDKLKMMEIEILRKLIELL